VKNRNKLIYLFIIPVVFSCRKENENDLTEFINYPEYTDYSENILFRDKTYIENNRNHSMAVNLP
jgi:5-methylthioribose kinase